MAKERKFGTTMARNNSSRRFFLDWQQIETILGSCARLEQHVLLYGLPGTGKSRAARSTGVPIDSVFAVNLTEDTTAVELKGYDRFCNGEFFFADGPCTRAWRDGGRLVLDDISRASGDAYSYLLGVLDDPSLASVFLPDGTRLRPKTGFHVVATCNCSSPDELPAPLRDRLAVAIEVIDPHPDALLSLPEDLRHVARNSAICPDPERRLSLRPWQAFAKLRENFGESLAATAVFGPRAKDLINALEVWRATGGKK